MTPSISQSPTVPRTVLGKTGVRVPVLGFGGIVVRDTAPEEAARFVKEAVEAGVTYFDVAPTYGNAEERLGPALEPWRDQCFLACKTHRRDRKGAEEDLKRSLERLRTDHFDLYQLHGLNRVRDDVEVALGRGGALEAVLEARERGQVRFIGFSAHTPEAALAAMKGFDFDTVMFPVNFACHFHRPEFDSIVLDQARKRNMGIIALKSLALRPWPNPEARRSYPKCWYQPIDDFETARLALSWTLSRGVDLAIPPGDVRLFRLALKALRSRIEIDAEADRRLAEIAGGVAPIFSE